MPDSQMLIGLLFGNGYGEQPQAWRMPWVDPATWVDFDALTRYAQAAERGKLDFLFLPDALGLDPDSSSHMQVGIESQPPLFTLEPMLTLAAVARATSRIGLAMTASTTFNDAYTLARQFKTLDLMSHGRVGWNAIPTHEEFAAANYGVTMPSREEKYERLHEMVQTVQALWGSWQQDAWIKDPKSGRFADSSKIQPVNMQGRHVASRGPLPIPPSEQGQPVIFQAGGGENGLRVAGRYANLVIGNAFSVEHARTQRAAVRQAAEEAGRSADEIKFVTDVNPVIADTHREALERRMLFGLDLFPQQVPDLGRMLSVSLTLERLDTHLTEAELASVRANPADPRAPRAVQVAREGWTIREILAHGVTDWVPHTLGPASVTADHMQEWFEAGAVDGFWVKIDVCEDGIDAFVDEVVPILQDRGLFHRDYRGATLREHLGVSNQYGTDPRLS